VELCQAHVSQEPVSPSIRLGRELSSEIEGAILSCLDKARAKRPQTARDLAQLLDRSPAARLWCVEDADNWWGRHERGLPQVGVNGPASQARPVTSADTSREFGQTVITGRNE
jgi:hypothetical protein